MRKISFVMLFLSFLMTGCGNTYDIQVETGMQALKDEKYSDAIMWFEKAGKEKSTDETKSYTEVAKLMNHGATALKDGKYLEARDDANQVLQKKKDATLEKSVKSNAENMLQKAKDIEEKEKERVQKQRKVDEEGIDKVIKAVDSIDEAREKQKKIGEALDKAENAKEKIEAKKNQ
ncbi:DUF4398 domain-containing protein [Bacillus cereus]|uniref:DUF4398 domain-containing protein n=1 Tax=unclassified Bacillus (in: firmicutes) TaxID=185979 RepID=UPI00047EED14|nr:MULTISPECIES: DUF4398 domain-containing protein [unclassified Bacillus (in: firmicutes)]PFE06231.1 DUF4398 domain-containing protein [Bacillus sp. AFS023182]PGY01201.1 DUF4398 domain-containing protein [Bacillus cereus]